ncbi:hypothetical protein ACO1O0_000653 [Amphichorda felina]
MNLAGPLIKYIASLTPAQVCQGVYILSSATILAINVLPEELRTMLVEYGARHQNRKDGKKQKGTLQGLVGLLEVPHSWFLHFYVVSVACSAFWAWQYLTHGAIMGWLAREQVRDGQASVELSRVFVVWGLSIAAAPPGKILGRTVFTGLVFVALNLGTTAGNTKKWYAQKFGSDKVEGKWKMIPYVF